MTNNPEGNHPLFVVAAQFPNSESLSNAYYEARNMIIRSPELELSIHRFQVVRTKILHLTVVGYSSNNELKKHINRILTRGEIVELPIDIIEQLSHYLRPIPSVTSRRERTQRSLVQPRRRQ